MARAAPTALQDIREAISPRDNDTFDFGNLSSTKMISLMSSAAPIPLQDDTQDSDTPGLDDFDEMIVCYTEDPDRYCLGLFYYPICIGDVLMGTYLIEHKLGHGDFSTVWLAHDLEKERDVALKIMSPRRMGEYELSMQKKIMSAVQGTSNLVTCLANFSLTGSSDDHQVLVFPVRGPNFRSVMLSQISMANRMSAAWQLLQALECLHNANIVHNSELTPTCFSLLVCMLNILQI
jgi:serine/threonine protein kinase